MAETEQTLCKCSRCKSTILQETYFSKNRKGVHYKTCDSCRTKKVVYQQGRRSIQKEFRSKNQAIIKERQRDYYHKNKEDLREQCRKRFALNKERYTETFRVYRSEKRHHCEHKIEKRTCKICNPNGHLKSLVSGRIHFALQRNKSKKSVEYLGCNIPTFRAHLEKSFKEGMTWENQGKDGWDIDHIIPVFYKRDGIAPSREEVCKRLHYSNCQAMWHTENVKKGNRYCGDYQSSSNDSDSG
jgi:hypothetical protein